MALFGPAEEKYTGGTSGGGTSSGGRSSSNDCPPGYRKNEYGKCVKIEGGSTGQRNPNLFGPAKETYVPTEAGEPMPLPENMVVDGDVQALLEMQKQMFEQQRQQARESAWSIMQNLLEEYDLGSLGTWLKDLIMKGDITEPAALIQQIRQRDEYKQRFPAMSARRSAGLNAISESEYLRLENEYRRILRASGLPPAGFDQPEELSRLIGYDVSPAELQARINDGYQQVAQAKPEVVNQFRRMYGLTDGDLAAYFLEPERTLPYLLRQARSAQIAGEARIQAGLELGVSQAEELATAGVTQQQAQTGFQAIAGAQELFGGLAGTTEQAIGTEEQIAGVFGTSAAAQQRIRQRTRERQSVFEAGGRFAAGQGGTVTGLQ